MAKDTTSPPGRSSVRGGRKPVTLDLPADQVVRKPAPDSAEPSERRSEGDASAAKTEPTATRKAEAAAASPAEKTPKDKRAEEPVIPSAFASWPPGQDPGAFAFSSAPAESAPGHSAERGSDISSAALAAAAVTGGIAAMLAAALLWLAGFLGPVEESGGPDPAAELAALRAEVAELREAPPEESLAPLREQVAALEEALGELQSQASAATPDPGALEQLQARINELEGLARDGQRLGSAGSTDFSGLERSLGELRQAIEQVTAHVAEIEARLADTRRQAEIATALGPAVAADALAAAVEAGRPFESEIAALRSLGVDEAALAGLEPYSRMGLPTMAVLRSDFEEAIAAVDLSTPLPEGTGTLDRLLESARGLIEMRPASPTAGTDPAAIVARLRGALHAGDLEAALAEWSALPESVKAETETWARAAEARLQAETLGARLRADALSRLKTEG